MTLSLDNKQSVTQTQTTLTSVTAEEQSHQSQKAGNLAGKRVINSTKQVNALREEIAKEMPSKTKINLVRFLTVAAIAAAVAISIAIPAIIGFVLLAKLGEAIIIALLLHVVTPTACAMPYTLLFGLALGSATLSLGGSFGARTEDKYQTLENSEKAIKDESFINWAENLKIQLTRANLLKSYQVYNDTQKADKERDALVHVHAMVST